LNRVSERHFLRHHPQARRSHCPSSRQTAALELVQACY
jgi:hypothetical protein